MAKEPARASNGPRPGINDDIGEEKRLTLYRLQVEIRESEQRAFDLFLQNLVKGTSHLSLGQEAVAAGFAAAMKPGDLSFCTYRGHAHTLARGVPISPRWSTGSWVPTPSSAHTCRSPAARRCARSTRATAM
jgi:pyruvate dehydrogenase E1 component alpha subunit